MKYQTTKLKKLNTADTPFSAVASGRDKLIHQATHHNYNTPFFYTSRQILRSNYQTFVDLFDDAEVYYALKANSDSKVLLYLNSLGCGFEAASAFEIDLLLSLGVSPNKIIYGTSIKPPDHIRRSYKASVTRFAADSREEIDKIAQCAPGAQVFIRAIVEDEGSVFTMSKRFGTPISTVKHLSIHAMELGLELYGISFYVGSQAAYADRWSNGIQAITPIIEELYREGIRLKTINIGGGFPVPYRNHQKTPELATIVTKIHNAIHALPYIPKLLMEPGRAMVATSTVLVAEVIARNDRSGHPWLCLDAGIYNALYESMIHQGATQYDVHKVITATAPATSEHIEYTLAGPTGDSLDVIAEHVRLPSDITLGDKLMFENVGAYSISMASHFNGFPTPLLYMD